MAFDLKSKGTKPPIEHIYIGIHIIFDIKIGNFQLKAHLVANGIETGTPASLVTYALVVSREYVRIALALAALDDLVLEVKTSDVKNAYLMAPTYEKLYTILGPEFSEGEWKTTVIC